MVWRVSSGRPGAWIGLNRAERDGRRREPVQWKGKAAVLGGGLAHDVSIRAWRRPPPRLAAACEASMTTMRAPQRGHGQGATRGASGAVIRLLLRVGGRRVGAEQCAGYCDVRGAVGVGEEPVVADAVEASGQHVQEKRRMNSCGSKPHRLPAVPARRCDSPSSGTRRRRRRLRRCGGSRSRPGGCNGKDRRSTCFGPANGALQ